MGHSSYGFFNARRPLDIGLDDGESGLIPYENIPRTCANVISAGKASYVELDEKLGLGDVYDLLEIINVDAANLRLLARRRKAKQ